MVPIQEEDVPANVVIHQHSPYYRSVFVQRIEGPRIKKKCVLNKKKLLFQVGIFRHIRNVTGNNLDTYCSCYILYIFTNVNLSRDV